MRRLSAALCLVLASPILPAKAVDLSVLSVNTEAPAVVRPQGATAIAGVKLEDLRGQEGLVTTFGMAFAEGDWPEGRDLFGQAAGATVPLQASVKARHPDGSVRHAIVSVVNPSASEAQIGLGHMPTQSAEPPLDLGSVLARGYNLTVEFDIQGARVSVDAAKMLGMALKDGTVDYWLRGPVVTEGRVQRKLTPALTVIFDIRVQRDGAVRTSIGFHNDAMFEVQNREVDYGVTIRMGGQVMAERRLTHRRYSNWREIVWAGRAPSEAHVVHDLAYMIAARAVPPYDPEVPVSSGFYRKQIESLSKGGIGPMLSASIEPAMPTTGGRADIGMVPDWTYAWLRAQSPETYDVMIANAEAAGSVPWHLRDSKTQRAPTLDNHPSFWADYRAVRNANGHDAIVTRVDDWKLDNAHQPDLSYVPYLASGDRYYLDNLHAQLAFGLLNYNPAYRGGAEGNLRNDQVRAQAWVNRTHAYAAFITPDDHPEKRYVTDKLEQRLAWYPRAYRADDKRGGSPTAETVGWIQGPSPKGEISNWMQDYFAQATAQARLMGAREAVSVWNYIRPYQLNRFLRSDFNPRWSTAYRNMIADKRTGEPYRTWREVGAATVAAGRVEANPTVIAGGHDKAWNYTAQARSSYANALTAFRDPLIAEAYAFMVRESTAMHSEFAQYPKWSVVPSFPDGSTVPISRHEAVRGRARGTDLNDLLAGADGSDTITGAPGNDIVAGFDGDDLIAGGGGIDFLAGGRGRDQIVLDSAMTYAAGGPGADVFIFGRTIDGSAAALGRSEIVDFRPGEDRLSFPSSLGTPRQVLAGARATRGGVYIPLGSGGGVMLHGVQPTELREDSLAMR